MLMSYFQSNQRKIEDIRQWSCRSQSISKTPSWNCLSLLTQKTMLAVITGSRSPRTIGIIAAAAGVAGPNLLKLFTDAACSALSVFSLCSDKTKLETHVDNLFQQQTVFQKTGEKVPNRNDENFFLLLNEVRKTQENVAKFTEVVNNNLQKLDVELREAQGLSPN